MEKSRKHDHQSCISRASSIWRLRCSRSYEWSGDCDFAVRQTQTWGRGRREDLWSLVSTPSGRSCTETFTVLSLNPEAFAIDDLQKCHKAFGEFILSIVNLLPRRYSEEYTINYNEIWRQRYSEGYILPSAISQVYRLIFSMTRGIRTIT